MKKFFLRGKAFMATDDVIIIKTHDADEKFFSHASRVIKGQGMDITKPYVVLYNDDDMDILEEFVEKWVAENAANEFGSGTNAYVAPIFFAGTCDNRVQWYVV